VYWEEFIQQALQEDVREGDHTSLSCIQPSASGNARLLVKDNGILPALSWHIKFFKHLDPQVRFLNS
jgi:nicotinate-nucleotide pyrophosphorylase (carboxylating)